MRQGDVLAVDDYCENSVDLLVIKLCTPGKKVEIEDKNAGRPKVRIVL